MRNKRNIKEILMENINLIRKINVDERKKDFIGLMILFEICKFIKEEYKEKLWRQLEMKLDILYEIHDILMEEGKKEGMKEFAERMLSAGESIKKIAEYTKLDREVINQLFLAK